MSEKPTDEPVAERISPNTGQVMGPIVVLLGLIFTVWGCLDLGNREVLAAGGLLLATWGWASLIHPALWLSADHLVIRGMVSTTRVPLAGVQSFAVRQVLVVHAGDKRHASPVLGRKRRRPLRKVDPIESMMSTSAPTRAGDEPEELVRFEDRMAAVTKAARAAAGVRSGTAEHTALGREGVRRTVDLVPALVVSVPLALFVAALLR